MKKVDLHIHSQYSDGTFNLSEIIKEAQKSGVDIISITDHNTVEAYRQLDCEYLEKNLEIITGVEIDSIWKGRNFHILGYGIDVNNKRFIDFLNRVSNELERFNERLIKKVSKCDRRVSLLEYRKYNYDKSGGGWKLLHYLYAKGVSNSLWDSFRIYAEYNHSYDSIVFPTLNEVCKEIHLAGGVAILAHPGKVLKDMPFNKFKSEIYEIVNSCEIDGIECYYPTHSEEITNFCLKVVKENNLLYSAGSDCHGDFEKTKIGELEVYAKEANAFQKGDISKNKKCRYRNE